MYFSQFFPIFPYFPGKIPGFFPTGEIHSCEKLKHHFFEVSFQNERKGCFGAAVAR